MNIKKSLSKWIDALFVKDVKCICCGEEIKKNKNYCICDKCLKTLPFITKSCSICGAQLSSGIICPACKQRKFEMVENISVFEYKFPINHIITAMKYENKQYFAPYLSSFLVDKYLEKNLHADYIVPVPISKERFKERGFNQSTLLCEKFSKINVPVKEDIVERIVDTPNQAHLTKQERLTNLLGAFRVVDKTQVKGKTILVVDDVYTTGSTVNEIAKVLFRAGANKVFSLTLSHGENKIPFEEIAGKKI